MYIYIYIQREKEREREIERERGGERSAVAAVTCGRRSAWSGSVVWSCHC